MIITNRTLQVQICLTWPNSQFFPCNKRVNVLGENKLKKTAEFAATSKINLVTIKIIFNNVAIYKLLFFGWLYRCGSKGGSA